jgi:monovalent cation/hydrogen antiporter
LQLRPILDELSGLSAWELLGEAVAITATVLAVRIIWVFVAGRGPATHRAVVSWMGMRGAVSLAAALALPLQTDAGLPFPGRDLIIFLAFVVILGTLVLQGLTLPALIARLGLEDDGMEMKEDTKARILAAEAALQRLDELIDEDWVRDDTAERMRGLYNFRRSRFAARFDGQDDGGIEERSMNYQRLRRELLEAERAEIVSLRRQGRISDDVMRAVERDLDLEDQRLDV